MKFNFRKITSVLASAVMLGSTIGLAAAANYPSPFISGGAADVAVVVGTSAATSDYLAAVNLGQSLQTELAKQTATTGTTGTGTVSGEAAALFTSSSKVYINSTLNAVKSVVTKTEMPILLKEETFSGNVDAKTTQTIVLGSVPQVTYAKQPTSSDDPTFGLATSSSSGQHTYNATVDFNKAVNFTHADSKNQEIVMLGQKFMVGAATDTSNLILLKSAEKLNFDSSGTTSSEVTIENKKYTVEMVSASATAATIKVTNEAGATEQKEVSEGYSKKINGVTIAVNTADSNNLKYTASIVAGAEKVTLTSGSTITYGDSDTVIDGTLATFTGGTTAMTKLVVSVRAPSSDKDAIKPGESFTDPVFGTFKVDFAGLNIAEDSTAREDIKVRSSGDDKVILEMTDNRGNAKSVQWAINKTDAIYLQWDSDGHNIQVSEMAAANKSDYVVVGNEDEGRLLKVYQIINQTTGYSNDKVTFQDIFTSDIIETTITAEGSGTATIGGKVYNVNYYGASDLSDDAKTIRINYPDSSSNDMLIYPTIQSSKGAKVFFYKPLTIALDNWDGGGSDTTGLKIPNGADAYQTLTIGAIGADNGTSFNVTVGSTTTCLDVTAGGGCATTSVTAAITNTGLTYNITASAANTTTIYLKANDGANIADPALVILEEKDDANQYQALIVTLEAGATGDDGIGVNDVIRTWGNDGTWDAISLYTDSKKTKEADKWGTIALIDSSDSDQKTATISYPDEQVYAQLYVSGKSATVTAGTTGGGTVTELGSVTVKDSEISSVQGKNLIVVGGSCINTVAAKLLGSDTKICGSDFTTKTGVGADQFLVQVVDNPYTTGKVAMLVAGYEAADTTKAVTYVTKEPNVVTDKGTTLKKVTATYADVTIA